MNFFQAQDKARRRTGLLVVLFSLAVLCLILLTQLLLMAAMHFGSNTALTLQGNAFWTAFSWKSLAEIALGIVTVVTLASLFKVMQLRAGGSAVAEMLGGHILERNSLNLQERKVLNVVEEMAIASGMPVPPVYVIEDDAINAFAAGHDTRDVAIGLTRGCINLLSRDELQGVIAHEFSHVFNGDMRINLRLIGILHGILFIGLIGRFLLENSHRSTRSSSKGAGPLIFLGVGLMAIGYLGTFFGNLIKAAISRQREFLADASAVQYTRNPAGISNALKKIGGFPLGSRMMHPRASEVSHLFFSDGMKHFISGSLFSTHPPLSERIQVLEPHWKGDFTDVALPQNSAHNPIDPDSVQIINGDIRFTRAAPATQSVAAITGIALMNAMDSIGTPSVEHLQQARDTLDTLPDQLRNLSSEAYGARAVVHCLLLDPDATIRLHQFSLLQSTTDISVMSLCEQLATDIDALPVYLRLPLIDLCLPSLKTLSSTQHKQFMKAVMAQIQADQQVSLFEWALYCLLRHHLGADKSRVLQQHHKLETLTDSCHIILSALALAAHDATTASHAFEAGWSQLGLPPVCSLNVSALQDMAALDRAALALRALRPLDTPRVLKACCRVIERDGQYAPASVELLRALADSLNTPIPPVVVVSRTL